MGTGSLGGAVFFQVGLYSPLRTMGLLGFKCSIVCTSCCQHKSSFVARSNSVEAKTEIWYDNVTIKVVGLERVFIEEVVAVVKLHSTFVKNVTFLLIMNEHLLIIWRVCVGGAMGLQNTLVKVIILIVIFILSSH